MYQKILKPNGIVHLKTDCEFLHGYTLGLLQEAKETLDRLIEQKILLTKAEEDTVTIADEILDDRVDQRIKTLQKTLTCLTSGPCMFQPDLPGSLTDFLAEMFVYTDHI